MVRAMQSVYVQNYKKSVHGHRLTETVNSIFVLQGFCDGDATPEFMDAKSINRTFLGVGRQHELVLDKLFNEMLSLQQTYHSGDYSDYHYDAAAEDYPDLYEKMIAGLTEKTLNRILETWKVRDRLDRITFVEQFREDRLKLALKPIAATMREEGNAPPFLTVV